MLLVNDGLSCMHYMVRQIVVELCIHYLRGHNLASLSQNYYQVAHLFVIHLHRKEVNLPIITRHELLHRIRYRNRTNGDDDSLAINSADNLPSVKPSGVVMTSRPDSIITPVPVPANSEIQTPCPPDDFMPQPPVIEIWRQWHDHHIHV